ncbi:hypothetical protein K502DRAFT_362126 [Neoconidiobolus thromboides FSU 785]|nr:hypothetical protein K502DRAFT_362126 [Neoconidiobolus thromboides FSU 785]
MSQFCKCSLDTLNKIIELPIDKVCSDCLTLCLELEEFSKVGEDVQKNKLKTNCFQRDSIKDKIMVYLFLIVTTLLLLTAFFKPHLKKWWKSRNRTSTFSTLEH